MVWKTIEEGNARIEEPHLQYLAKQCQKWPRGQCLSHFVMLPQRRSVAYTALILKLWI